MFAKLVDAEIDQNWLLAFTVLVAAALAFGFKYRTRQLLSEEGDGQTDDLDGEMGESEDMSDLGPTGLVSKFKAAQLKKLEAELTQDQLAEERRVESEQLAAIFEMLKKQEAALNTQEIDEGELKAQLNLYR